MAKAGKKLEVLVLNPIAQVGLKRLPADRFEMVKESKSPDVILVRSQDNARARLARYCSASIREKVQPCLV